MSKPSQHKYNVYADVDGDGDREQVQQIPGGKLLTIYQVRKLKKRFKNAISRIDPRRVVKPKPPTANAEYKRALMKEWMQWALANEGKFHYQQSRPIPLLRMKDRRLPIYSDCSGTTIGCHYAAGIPDPNGSGYDGYGYTGTIRNASKQIRLKDARVGDMIIYGSGTGRHMVMVYEPHPTDPITWSHGQEAGPILVRHSVEIAVHGAYFTVHRAEV